MKSFIGVTACILAVTLSTSSASQAATVTVALTVDPSSTLSDYWTAGDLVEVTVRASSDGGSGQGFSGADLGSGSFGVTVDGTSLKIHDVKFNGTVQVDTESSATSFDGLLGYVKADDTWVYDEFTDFVKPDPNDTRNIILTDTRMRAIPSAILGQYDLGRGTPADFVHIVFEVQAGFASNSSSAVTFYGQMGAYGVAQQDIASNIFGTVGGDVNSGSFSVTNLPEPATVGVLLVGLVSLLTRRRATR